jgi:ribosomal protein L32
MARSRHILRDRSRTSSSEIEVTKEPEGDFPAVVCPGKTSLGIFLFEGKRIQVPSSWAKRLAASECPDCGTFYPQGHRWCPLCDYRMGRTVELAPGLAKIVRPRQPRKRR